MKHKCLSIVSPGGTLIAQGKKTLEVRSWIPNNLDYGEDLLIVENSIFLRNDGDTDLDGRAVALVKVKKFREYVAEDIPAACASRWDPGYCSWELYDVRSIKTDRKVIAARGIYEVEIDL
jgi:ASCH domain